MSDVCAFASSQFLFGGVKGIQLGCRQSSRSTVSVSLRLVQNYIARPSLKCSLTLCSEALLDIGTDILPTPYATCLAVLWFPASCFGA